MSFVVIVVLLVIIVVLVLRLRELSGQVRLIRKANKRKAAFLRNLGHDIRTPLHAVSGLADIISNEGLYLSKTEKRNISDQIHYNANLIATLLDEVMLFSDTGGQGHLLEDESFSPNLLCRRCLDSNLVNRKSDDVQMSFRRELSDEFFVRSDRHVVELILNKLIDNACHFTEKGEIQVGCNTTENPDQLTIYVQDTGGGIPEDRKDRLFDWMEQPDEDRNIMEMVLSVAQKQAMKLGGFLRLDDSYQKGTRMLLILPLK